MKTITTTTITLLLAAVTVGLGPQQAWATDAVPFKGNAQGAITSATPAPGGVLVTVLADGYATQLGKFSREEVLLLNPVTGSAVGTIVFTAANGDQLSGVVTAQFTSPTTLVATYTFTGGTGRFADATGEAQALLSTPDGAHFTAEFEGSVTSVGINKN
jgi:hypothetical protein